MPCCRYCLWVRVFSAVLKPRIFGLGTQQRLRLQHAGGMTARAVDALLADQSSLLVTLMLGNMMMNVGYFVVTSALLLQLDPKTVHPAWIIGVTFVPLLIIILFGEVLPKLVANTAPVGWVRVAIVPLYAAHRVVAPMGLFMSRWFVSPMVRLLAPRRSHGALSTDELQALVEMSQHHGVIAAEEHELLEEIIALGDLKVRDVMVPRVDIESFDLAQPAAALRTLIEKTGRPKILACHRDIDHVAGVIQARQFLLEFRLNPTVMPHTTVLPVRFVPELQRVDALLEDFRNTGTHMAVVVDEYGGTAGLVTLKDVVEQMLGDLDMDGAPGETPETTTQRISTGVWRVSGRLSVHDWADAFGAERLPPRISTVGGLVMTLLGHVPKTGDRAQLANLELEVEHAEAGRVESVILRLLHEESAP